MRFFLTICLVLWSATAWAQSGRERSGFVYTYEGAADTSGGGRLALRETELRTGVPLIRSDAFMLTAGLRWTHYDFLLSGEGVEDFTAHSVRFPFRAAWPRETGWSWSAVLAPAILSDLKAIGSDDFGLSALALGTYPWRPELRLAAGAAYSQDFGRSRVFPALGATWTPNEAWIVELLFPRPRVVYRVSEQLSVGAGMEPGGDQWNIEIDGVVRDVALKEYRAALGLEWTPVRNFVVIAQAGAVFGREFDARGGDRPRIERDIDDTWYARIGLVFR